MPHTEATPSFLVPGTLWDKIKTQTQHALDIGALHSIPTQYEFITDGGIEFVVRSLDNIARKEKARKQQTQASSEGKPNNPFLPYETNLFVSNLSDSHLCLLNKYNVVDHHLLIVTRAFEEQETWLNSRDFEALWRCMAEIDGLAFYNGGQDAGASQPHKHLQLVPMSLTPGTCDIPVNSLIHSKPDIDPSPLQSIQAFPFPHAVKEYRLDSHLSIQEATATLIETYRQLVHELELGTVQEGDRQTGAYNLLATRRWMMLVPRSQDRFASISVNSLGFAGSLFVSTEKQMKTLKDLGPMTVLQNVAWS